MFQSKLEHSNDVLLEPADALVPESYTALMCANSIYFRTLPLTVESAQYFRASCETYDRLGV